MADLPPVSYKLVILILLLHTCSSFILLEHSPTVTKIKEEVILLEPYNEEIGTFVEITTDQKTKNVLSTESKDMSLTNLAIQTARSPAGDLPQGVAPLARLIEQISQENAADMTKEKMFAMAKELENMLKEILAPASAS